ncbi:hypothetical protein INT45_013965 [Circinella minor]|uniref:Uncharacterized protein n=1 Tax=Circinella minor TaxID=1195481 RepID=A0A8H7VE86_9FUNG|nr:hypothetical protein INT45_013965 [Circinella minor]
MESLALTHKEIRETVKVTEGEDPFIEEFIRTLDSMRQGKHYEPVDELPVVKEIQKIMEHIEHLQKEVIRLNENKRQVQTKWDKEDKEIKEAIKQCAIERKGYGRTVVPASTMHRWVQEYIKTQEGQKALKQNHAMAIVKN